jgi:ethanolamine ammonia-lyase large subunit
LCQEFLSQALIPFEESHIPSFVADSQPPLASKVVDVEVGQCSEQPQFVHLGSSSQSTVQSLVESMASKVVVNIAKARKEKELIDASSARKTAAASMKVTMKWLPFQSTFILQKMCELIKTYVHTDEGFKRSI